MKLRKIYNIIVNDIIYATSSDFKHISKEFERISKIEKTAYIQTCYN